MKALHIFLGCVLLACCIYIAFYEGIAWNASWNSDPRSLWNFFYVYSIAQGNVTCFYILYTGLSLHLYKMDWEMINFMEMKKIEAKYTAKIENLLKK